MEHEFTSRSFAQSHLVVGRVPPALADNTLQVRHDPTAPVTAECTALRQFDRIPTQVNAILYCGDRFQPTIVSDVSLGGMRLEGAHGVLPGDQVGVTLVTGHSHPGVVRWWLNGSCGIALQTPLRADDPLITLAVRKARPRAATAECQTEIVGTVGVHGP